MRHPGTLLATNAVTPPTSRVKVSAKRAEKSEKLNDLKVFRIPSRDSTGSPPGGLAAVNAFHMWFAAIESERAHGAF
jgi:hypothetical protein